MHVFLLGNLHPVTETQATLCLFWSHRKSTSVHKGDDDRVSSLGLFCDRCNCTHGGRVADEG